MASLVVYSVLTPNRELDDRHGAHHVADDMCERARHHSGGKPAAAGTAVTTDYRRLRAAAGGVRDIWGGTLWLSQAPIAAAQLAEVRAGPERRGGGAKI